MTSHIGDLRHIKIWTTYNACNLVISHLICFFTVTNTFHFYGSFLVVQSLNDMKRKIEKTVKNTNNAKASQQCFSQHQEIPSFIFSDFCYLCIPRPCHIKILKDAIINGMGPIGPKDQLISLNMCIWRNIRPVRVISEAVIMAVV